MAPHSFVIFIIDIIIVIEIIQRNKGLEKKVLWVVVILLPVVGPILYYLIGRGK